MLGSTCRAKTPKWYTTKSHSSESRRASTHDFALTDQFGIEFASVEREVNVEIHSVKRALRRIHALKVLFERLARQIRCERDYFFDS